jgi:hypothetical protein
MPRTQIEESIVFCLGPLTQGPLFFCLGPLTQGPLFFFLGPLTQGPLFFTQGLNPGLSIPLRASNPGMSCPFLRASILGYLSLPGPQTRGCLSVCLVSNL